MDLATLGKLEPSEFGQAADGYRAAGDMAGMAKDHIVRVVIVDMRNPLKGRALEAAAGELRKPSVNSQYTQLVCGLVGTALNGFAPSITRTAPLSPEPPPRPGPSTPTT